MGLVLLWWLLLFSCSSVAVGWWALRLACAFVLVVLLV